MRNSRLGLPLGLSLVLLCASSTSAGALPVVERDTPYPLARQLLAAQGLRPLGFGFAGRSACGRTAASCFPELLGCDARAGRCEWLFGRRTGVGLDYDLFRVVTRSAPGAPRGEARVVEIRPTDEHELIAVAVSAAPGQR
jgi:hypothetical protein